MNNPMILGLAIGDVVALTGVAWLLGWVMAESRRIKDELARFERERAEL